jgi:hypothetical protein
LVRHASTPLETPWQLSDRSQTRPEEEGTGSVNEAPRLLYDRHSAAQQLSISVRSLDSFIAAKKIGFRRIGRRVLIPHGELVKFSRADHFDIPNDIAA